MKKLLTLQQTVSAWPIWSLVASLTSGLVIVIAFLIPSFEEQYDRYQAHRIVGGYLRLGKALLDNKKYALAEDAFQTAFELSGNTRLDIDILKLRARIEAINEESEWGAPLPRRIKEIDLIYLLHLSEHSKDHEQESIAHSSYALFLAEKNRLDEARTHLEKAIELDPNNYGAQVDFGVFLSEVGHLNQARLQLQKAINVDPSKYLAYYNLGQLELEQKNFSEAVSLLQKAAKLNPTIAVKDALERAREHNLEKKTKGSGADVPH